MQALDSGSKQLGSERGMYGGAQCACRLQERNGSAHHAMMAWTHDEPLLALRIKAAAGCHRNTRAVASAWQYWRQYLINQRSCTPTCDDLLVHVHWVCTRKTRNNTLQVFSGFNQERCGL